MTDPSLQKMQTTPESNVQKMHIPAEWVEAGARAAAVANNDDPDFLGYQQNKPNWQLWSPCIEAALTAVIPLIRADAERERDRYREALQRVTGLSMSQFLLASDMAAECLRIARQALEGDK